MKFAIISDTHDNIANLQKAIDWLNQEKIGLLLHCGDICSQETVDMAEKEFKGEFKYVRGNGDFNLDNVPDTLDLDINGPPKDKKVAMVHYPDLARRLAESGKYDMVFYGHTHKPWEEKVVSSSIGSGRVCHLINPGELAGQRYKPCFAIYDTQEDKLELKVLEKI